MKNTETELAVIEDHEVFSTIRFKERDDLYISDHNAMIELWHALEKLKISNRKIIILRMPKYFLSSKVVDHFWQRVEANPTNPKVSYRESGAYLMSATDAAMHRILEQLRSITALTIGVFEGEVDFDLLGVLLACKYRICTTNTTFVNRTLKRNVPPASGTLWFLSRMIGHAKARKLYIDEASLSVEQAHDLGIIDQISKPDNLEQDSLDLAQRFATKDDYALRSLMHAVDLAEFDFSTYLERAKDGFKQYPQVMPM